jgi:hypothetical protein
MRAPAIVSIPLCMIAAIGLLFAITTVVSGTWHVAAFFMLLPTAAFACYRLLRWSRTFLFVVSLGAVAPLAAGIVISWPERNVAVLYFLPIAGIFCALAVLLSREAREWHASAKAHRLLD